LAGDKRYYLATKNRKINLIFRGERGVGINDIKRRGI